MKSLWMLNCNNNELEELNLSQNVIYSVFCENNNLVTLKLGMGEDAALHVYARFNYLSNPPASGVEPIVYLISPRKNYTFVVNSDDVDIPVAALGYNYYMFKGVTGTPKECLYSDMIEYPVLDTKGLTYFRADKKFKINKFTGDNAEVSFTMESEAAYLQYPAINTVVPITIKKVPFKDIGISDWYGSAVAYVNEHGLMTGLDAAYFGPIQTLARAQFSVILHRMNGEPEITYTGKFPDVSAGQWYTNAILWANSINVVSGYSSTGLFGPEDNINREQMAVMMYRYAQYKGYDISQQEDISKYADASSVTDFAKDAMKWAVGTGIITGKDSVTRLDPQGNASRAECATIIMRFVEKYNE